MSCSTNEASMTWDGIYRQGFEQNDFYRRDGQGPYWLDLSKVDVDMTPFVTETGGRGSHTTVKIKLIGELTDMPEFAYSERYTGQLTASEILTIEALEDETWWKTVEAFSAGGAPSGAQTE